MKNERLSHCILSMLLVITTNGCFAQSVLSRKQWLEDAEVLKQSIYQKHVNPFWKTPKQSFDSLFAIVKSIINNGDESKLQPELLLTKFAQILALTRDGHSGVSTKSRAELFGLYNYNVAWFPEGLFITRVEEDKKTCLGSKVIKIDNTPIEEAKKLVNSVSTSFHESGFKRFSPRYLESPAILYGLAISKDPKQVILTLQNENGAISTVNFQRRSLKEQEKTKFISLNDISTSLPLYRQNLKKNYWFQFLPEQKLLYLNYVQVQNSKEESMETFVGKISQTVEKEDVQKFVIDLRLNPGGDQFTAWPLLAFIYLIKK